MNRFIVALLALALCSSCGKYFKKPAPPAKGRNVSSVRCTWDIGGLDLDWSQITVVGVLDGKVIATATRETDELILSFSLPSERPSKDVIVRVTHKDQTIIERPFGKIGNVVMRTALTRSKEE